MCCPLIFCRNETMNGAEGPNKMPIFIKERTERWHDKRVKRMSAI